MIKRNQSSVVEDLKGTAVGVLGVGTNERLSVGVGVGQSVKAGSFEGLTSNALTINNTATTMTTTITTDKTKARRATLAPLDIGQHLPAVDFAACHTDACVTPSGASVPFQGASSLGAGEQRTAGSMFETMANSQCEQMGGTLIHFVSTTLGGNDHAANPSNVESGRPLPEPSIPLLPTTQGTGAQGKTCGQDPGPRPHPATQEEEENAVQFRPTEEENAVQFHLAIEGDNGGGVLDIMESENFEFYTPSDDDDNDDLFPEDIIDLSLQEKGRNASEFSGDLLPTKRGRIPRYLSKRTRRQRKAIAKAAKAEEDKAEDYRVSYGFTEQFVLCLPCDDEAYEDDIFSSKCRSSQGARHVSNPLRTSEVEMNPIGSIQPWLVSADDDSLSDTINNEQPIGTRTLSKPELMSEHRGPGNITAAALQIFGQEEKSAQRRSRKSAKYPGDMLNKACKTTLRDSSNLPKVRRMKSGSTSTV